MRPHAIFATFAIALLAVMPAAAQEAEGCVEGDPCPWVVDLDATGFQGAAGETQWNFTVGDWFVLNVTNFDEVDHTVVLDGHGIALVVPSFGSAESAPFNFTRAGTFTLRDDVGNAATVIVVAGDVVDYESGLVDESGNPVATTTRPPPTGAPSTTPASQGSSGPAAGLAVAVLALAAVLRRR
jgi:MYXO-CTERM domain-containing protein